MCSCHFLECFITEHSTLKPFLFNLFYKKAQFTSVMKFASHFTRTKSAVDGANSITRVISSVLCTLIKDVV